MTNDPAASRSWVRVGGTATLRGVALTGIALGELVLFSLLVIVGSLIGVGVGLVLLPPVMMAVRRLMNVQRRLAGVWSGVRIPAPYLPQPQDTSTVRRSRRLLGERASWRDAAWLLVDSMAVAWFLPFLPLALIVNGVRGVLIPLLGDTWLGNWYGFLPLSGPVSTWIAAVLGVAQLALALWIAPRVLRAHARLAARLLGPTEKTLLAHRVQRLTETRDDAVGSQASELRRIERDLHDGTQARLVAMGMTLDAATRIMGEHPEAAKSLIAEAKSNSAKALRELRDLVRGIQPPILADRGIADAIRALAMENPLRIETSIELPGRPPAAVETAAYFSVCEILNNAVKHSGAEMGRIDARYADGRLLITISDAGRGGADPARGSGLRGVERRLAQLDGFITVLSPLGGPTMIAVEVPCELSV